MAEEWEALLHNTSVTWLLGINSLRAFEGCDSVVGVNAFVRSAFVRLFHREVPGYDPFRDLESRSLEYCTYSLKEDLYMLASVGYTASQRRNELESPPSKTWRDVLRRLQDAHTRLLQFLETSSSPFLPFMKDASFKPSPMPWTGLAVEWSHGRPHTREWCCDTRLWLWEVGMAEEAAVLLGNPWDSLLRLISTNSQITTRSGEAHAMAEFHARAVWPRAMQERLPALVGECARVLPVIALPELISEYVFGAAVRGWLPRHAV
jgi:hypothetical protein